MYRALDIEHPGRTLHLRYSTDVHSVRGIGPLGRANALVNLANTIENSLSKEAGSLVGYILPIPTDDGRTEGTSNREAWRRFLHSTLQPLAKLVQGGMDIEEAAQLTGLISDEGD